MAENLYPVSGQTLTVANGDDEFSIAGIILDENDVLPGDELRDGATSLPIASLTTGTGSGTLEFGWPGTSRSGYATWWIWRNPAKRQSSAYAAQQASRTSARAALISGQAVPWRVATETNTPWTSPLEGDRYLIGSSPTGAWSGKAGLIVERRNGQDVFSQPSDGDAAIITDTKLVKVYDGAWALGLAPLNDGDKGDITVSSTGATWRKSNSLAAFASVALAAASSFTVLDVPAQAYTINSAVDLGQKVFDIASGGSFTGSSSAEPSGYTWSTGTRFGRSIRNTSRNSYDQYLAVNANPLSSFDLMQTVMTVDDTATVEHLCGFASYIRNRMAAAGIGRNTVGFFGLGTAEVDGSIWWGVNTLFQDSATRATHSGTGRLGIGAELDFNVTGTNTQIIGISVGGNSLAQPAQANAYIANSLSGASPGSVARWTTGFWVPDACATNGLALGATATSGSNVNSIPILLQYFNGSGVKKTLTVRAGTNAVSFFNDDSFCQLQTDALSLTGNATIAGAAVVPTVIGGGGAASSLTLQATFGAGAGSEFVRVVTGNNGATEVARFTSAGTRLRSLLTVSPQTTALTAPSAAAMLHLAAADGSATQVLLDCFGGSANFTGRRANGTNASRSALPVGQIMTAITAQGWDGTAYSGTRARIAMLTDENWTSTAQGAYITFSTTAPGTTTIVDTLALYASKALFTVPVLVPSYTVAGVPSASGAGASAIIYVSNESGGAVLAFSDGTNWRRVTDRAVIS